MNQPISTKQAAAQLGVSQATIVRLITQGELTAEKKTTARNSPYVVEANSIEAFREKRRQPNPDTRS